MAPSLHSQSLHQRTSRKYTAQRQVLSSPSVLLPDSVLGGRALPSAPQGSAGGMPEETLRLENRGGPASSCLCPGAVLVTPPCFLTWWEQRVPLTAVATSSQLSNVHKTELLALPFLTLMGQRLPLRGLGPSPGGLGSPSIPDFRNKPLFLLPWPGEVVVGGTASCVPGVPVLALGSQKPG